MFWHAKILLGLCSFAGPYTVWSKIHAQLFWTELHVVPVEVLSQLSSQPALVRTMQFVEKRSFLLPHETMVSWGNAWQIQENIARWTIPSPWFQSSPSIILHRRSQLRRRAERRGWPKVIVFATQKNIEILCHNSIWFVDGTFKTAPSIFAQIFTIIGLWEHTGHSEEWLRYHWCTHSCQESFGSG